MNNNNITQSNSNTTTIWCYKCEGSALATVFTTDFLAFQNGQEAEKAFPYLSDKEINDISWEVCSTCS